MMMQALKETVEAPITIEPFPKTETASGFYSRTDHSIHVRAGMSEAQTVKTTIHEAAHSILHSGDIITKTAETRECEAESVAYIVCNHFGIDTSDYSFPYLAAWASSAELPELQASLATIQQTANDLITKLSAKIKELQPEQAKEKNEDVLPVAQSSEMPMSEISDKTFITVRKDEVDQLVPKLNEQGIPYHVTQNTDAAIVTFSKADAARVNDLHKSLQPVVGSPSEAPKKIGNTPYHQIENKSYVRIANEAINAVMQGLDEKGIHYSGLIDAVKGNVITVSKADKPLVIQLQQNALEQKPSTVADTAAVSYRFKNVTAAELAQIKSADIQIAASKQKDDGFIIKIAAQDAKRIDAVLASGSNVKKLK